ncbi:hypothetical protein Bphy_3213 [Paraburkholderia phymatum STM815]|uniref:Uncharacterized protein n=1 Tax=Paraburkholderia phymatum (strain DSM 17167 / CIP 108236 / LMG 21445 / STM815) TaxID=391038 RepID=B2JRP6_PARP8|nr:hypothetical protein Bphy_3213 [Paraburkholderia phymatum STM815]
MMNFRDTSLRSLVEKWLGAESAACARVTHFSHTRSKPWRYVCIKAIRASGTFAFVFFRHDDGSWCVFPPGPRRPTMNVSSMDRSGEIGSRCDNDVQPEMSVA